VEKCGNECFSGKKLSKERVKELEEMLKKKVKPAECPYRSICDHKVLSQEASLMCKDEEIVQEAIMIHMSGHHVWEACETFLEKKREKEGRFPKDW